LRADREIANYRRYSLDAFITVRTMKIFGIILIVLGLLGFVFGSISWQQEEKVADVGPLEIETEETRTIPITPLASGAAVVAGIILVVAGTRRTNPQ
jgi:uncharacterized membrane protein YidH (DUF202 family)